MRSIRVFIRNNFILKGIFLALSYVFPFTFWCYLTGFKNLDPTNFVWVGVYSCLLLCLSVRSMVIRAGMVSTGGTADGGVGGSESVLSLPGRSMGVEISWVGTDIP